MGHLRMKPLDPTTLALKGEEKTFSAYEGAGSTSSA